jgi:resuscitation-promoting factor RpfA
MERDPSDPALDRLLRADPIASPPAELDAAILAAAHRAVVSTPREAGSAEATRPWRWWAPLAAAAAIGAVAIGVLQLMPSERESAPAVVSDMPAATRPQPNAVPAPSPAPAPSLQPQPSVPKVTAETQPPRSSTPVRRKASEPAAAPEPFPADRAPPSQAPPSRASAQESAPAAPPPARESAQKLASPPSPPAAPMNAESARRDAGQSAAGALDRAAAPALAKSAIKDEMDARRADEFVARIRRLRSEGRSEEAARELAAFRAAFADADARLPPDLREWAASVKR